MGETLRGIVVERLQASGGEDWAALVPAAFDGAGALAGVLEAEGDSRPPTPVAAPRATPAPPARASAAYLKSITMSSTIGPGVRIDPLAYGGGKAEEA